jgi:hypothetical protein
MWQFTLGLRRSAMASVETAADGAARGPTVSDTGLAVI